MKAQEFDLEDVTVKKDTVIIDFNTDSGNVSLQVSKESLLEHAEDNFFNYDYNWDSENYLKDNLRDVVKSYLQENL